MASTVIFILGSVLHLVLSQSPEFLTNTSQVVVVKGETAVIPCRIRNIGNYKVLWSFERVLLTFDMRRITDDLRYTVERPYQTEWNLHIADVKKKDAGTYHCQVNTNPMTSSDVKLLVLDEAPSPVVPKEVKAFSGSDVEIKCKLPDLNEIATWSYKVNEESPKKNIAEDDKFRFRSGQGQDSHVHTLVISDAKARDQGFYLCRARSGVEAKTALKVVEPPPPPSLEVKAESPNSLLVRWRQPSVPDITVAGYILYVLSHRTDKEHVFEVEPSRDVLGEESFRLGDLSTDTVYTVQLATELQMGGPAGDVTVGKRSSGVNITTPLFVPQAPGWVKVRRVSDEEADVEWSAPVKSKMDGIIRGFHISYVPLDRKKKPIAAKEKKLTVESPTGGKWKARLKGLKPKTRYHVRVRGFTHRGLGRQSKTIPYLHKALPPELSVNGRVLSDNSILLSLSTLGKAKMTNIRIFFTEAERPMWKRLDFSQQWKFTVVGGLEPQTSYFFKVRAKIGGKWKQCVTHMTTSPHNLQPPQNVKVSATASTSIDVTWDYVIANNVSSLPLGYIVLLEETGGLHGGDGHTSSQQSVVFNRTSTEIKDLKPGTKYGIQVTAFNGFGEGPRTESILFHIAESDVKQDLVDERSPPRFRHELPERVSVQPGEPIKVTCEADGSPVPSIQWYSDGEPIGVPAEGSNQLVLANVQKSTVLLCRATSALGEAEATIQVDMPEPEPVKKDNQASDGMVLKMEPENIQPTTFTLAWNLDSGDARSVERFEIAIFDKDYRELLTRQVPPQSRTFHLHSLQPGTEYKATITAFGGPGGKEQLAQANASAVTLNIDGSDAMPAPTRAPTPKPTPAPVRHRGQITMDVMDVLPNSASVEWGFKGLDPRHVQMFEMKVMSSSNRTLLTETLQPHLSIMQLSLQPDQLYYIQVRAYDRRGKVLAENVTSVTTPSADATTQPPTTPPLGPVLKKASLTLTSHAVTGDSARLDWNLAGAQQNDIGQFLMKVKDNRGRTLLRQEMTREARSLTLNNLSPRTTYVVEVDALDSRGAVLASSATSLTTTAPNAQELDTDPRKLRVFTEELDTNYVKIAWATPHILIPELSGVSVQLTDIANVSLLTQQMSPLTRSLTVRQLQPGETYFAHVQLKGSRGEMLKEGTLEFTTQPTPGMPGRPEIRSARNVNNSAVRLDWVTTPSPSPVAGSEDVTGYAINYANVDAKNVPLGGIYQLPVFGSEKFVIIPNLTPGKRYMFQVAARNKYSFGPLSAPAFSQLPR